MILPRVLFVCGLLSTMVAFALAVPAPEVLYSWTLDPNLPSGMIQGSDGDFYGVSGAGGAADLGTVFKMTPAGVVTTLVEFTGSGAINKGFLPNGGLIQGSDGNFYGTTAGTEPAAFGTIFRMTPSGQLTTLVDFTPTLANPGSDLGVHPLAGLVEGSDGNFYGTTAGNGSSSNYGTVFKMTPAGVVTTLVHFTSNGATNKGAAPRAALIQGSDGNFYGTTSVGGANNQGTIFRMTPAGVLTTLVEISGGTGTIGNGPSELVQGSDGNFYGTIIDGGAGGWGTIFRMTPAGVLTTLVEFTRNGPANKGALPRAALLKGSDGNFYGMTSWGGVSDVGTVFKMTPSGVLTTLVEFTGDAGPNKGGYPASPLIQGGDGSSYGTTSVGGAGSHGTIFKMTPAGALTTLAEQFIARKGANPAAGLVQGSDGDFYGTTQGGGMDNFGTVFKITSAGMRTTLAEFGSNGTGSNGQTPLAARVQGDDGNFYGSTQYGGTSGYGTIFKVTPAGVRTTLVNFTSNGTTNKGAYPQSELVQSSDGNLYGTTTGGGAAGYGSVFKMTPGGVLTTLVEFTGNGILNKGSYPQGALVQASDSDFYGTTSSGGSGNNGTIFKMTPTGVLTTLFEFPQVGQFGIGAVPSGTLIQGSDGNLYGTTQYGGPTGNGTVFKMTPAGVVTTLVQFSGNGATNKGANPATGVILGSDGNYYGTTSAGGTDGLGTIFMMTPDGTLTTLMNLTHGPNLGKAQAYRLAQGSDGNLYGTTSGGDTGGGNVYKLAPVGAPIFRAITASVSASAGGSVSGGGNRYSGSRVTLLATPNPAYSFVSWTEGGKQVSTMRSYSLTANADRTVVANFATGPNANLASLVADICSLSPAFAGATTNYTARVPQAATSITLTPTVEQGGASVKVNGVPVPPGTASGAIPLNMGANSITTIVTAPDGVTTKVYWLTVTRGNLLRDVNGDGNTDLVFQNDAGQIAAWYMNGSGTATSAGYVYSGGLGDWKVKGMADMNGDGNTDYIFQNTAGQIAVWYMTPTGTLASSVILYSGGLGDWKLTAASDINGDGKADLIFQNTAGQIAVWYMNGSGGASSSAMLYSGGLGDWKVTGVADLNGDGKADIVFQNAVGQIAVWYMNGNGGISGSAMLYSGGLGDWKLAAIAEMNGDGKADLIFQNTAGQIAVWYMNGSGGVSGSAMLYSGSLGDWRVR